jgi:hypothetical protein
MCKTKLAVILIIFGFLGLQYTYIAQAQVPPEEQMKKNQTNNKLINQNS